MDGQNDRFERYLIRFGPNRQAGSKLFFGRIQCISTMAGRREEAGCEDFADRP
jgi:hypothetical protein